MPFVKLRSIVVPFSLYLIWIFIFIRRSHQLSPPFSSFPSNSPSLPSLFYYSCKFLNSSSKLHCHSSLPSDFLLTFLSPYIFTTTYGNSIDLGVSSLQNLQSLGAGDSSVNLSRKKGKIVFHSILFYYAMLCCVCVCVAQVFCVFSIETWNGSIISISVSTSASSILHSYSYSHTQTQFEPFLRTFTTFSSPNMDKHKEIMFSLVFFSFSFPQNIHGRMEDVTWSFLLTLQFNFHNIKLWQIQEENI